MFMIMLMFMLLLMLVLIHISLPGSVKHWTSPVDKLEGFATEGRGHDGAVHQMLRFEFKLRHDVKSSRLDTISAKCMSNNTLQNPNLSFQTGRSAPLGRGSAWWVEDTKIPWQMASAACSPPRVHCAIGSMSPLSKCCM